LDVHKRTVVACVLVTALDGVDGAVTRTVRTFTTMTAGLLALSDWLRESEVLQVAMESTGVYWRPVFNILEDGRTVTLVNAQHLQRVPGRKTDVRLRHEVVSVAVGPGQSGPNLVFCHQYPTAACGRSNSAVRSPRDNVASPQLWSPSL
jgi:hypothetical protein